MLNRELSFHKTRPARDSSDSRPAWSENDPAFAVVENDDEVAIRTELPGLSGREVSVRCENGVLHVSGGKIGMNEKKIGHFRSRENWAEIFSRSLELGNRRGWSHARASLEDGVLTVRLRKSATPGDPRIEIPVH
jgi:HSP20 family molecular chaperone IbpA